MTEELRLRRIHRIALAAVLIPGMLLLLGGITNAIGLSLEIAGRAPASSVAGSAPPFALRAAAAAGALALGLFALAVYFTRKKPLGLTLLAIDALLIAAFLGTGMLGAAAAVRWLALVLAIPALAAIWAFLAARHPALRAWIAGQAAANLKAQSIPTDAPGAPAAD
jgi:hypothetical protein